MATIHRAENTDDPRRLSAIVDALAGLSVPVDLYAHPRLRQRALEAQIDLNRGALSMKPPAAYVEFMAAIRSARGVITDSGGLQKEAYMLGTLCTTVRTETEWAETLQDGWNLLVEPEDLLPAALRQPPSVPPNPKLFGDGRAASEIIDVLEANNC